MHWILVAGLISIPVVLIVLVLLGSICCSECYSKSKAEKQQAIISSQEQEVPVVP
jgi:hypothetical protein